MTAIQQALMTGVTGGAAETCQEMQNRKSFYEHHIAAKTFLRWESGRKLPELLKTMAARNCPPAAAAAP